MHLLYASKLPCPTPHKPKWTTPALPAPTEVVPWGVESGLTNKIAEEDYKHTQVTCSWDVENVYSMNCCLSFCVWEVENLCLDNISLW